MQEAVTCLENGKLEVEGEVLDAAADLESRLEFSREGEHWESTSKADGSLVVAVDCTQDAATQSSGMSRELMTGIQQLRKAAGLDLKDVVEVFFEEEEGVSLVEDAVAGNVGLFDSKFKGSIPLPSRFAPSWSVPLKSETIDVGGSSCLVKICRPAVAARDDIAEAAKLVLSSIEPSTLAEGQNFEFVLNGKKDTVKEGLDFWKTTVQGSKLDVEIISSNSFSTVVYL